MERWRWTRRGCHLALGDDCADHDAARYPGNTEIPDDGIDQDCDGEDLLTEAPPAKGCATAPTPIGWSLGLLVFAARILTRRRSPGE